MTTALLVTANMGGNLPPMLGIGQELNRRGHRVLVHADESVRARAELAGLGFVPAAGFAYDAAADRSTLATLRDISRFWTDRERGRDAVAVARREGADVAVVDVLLVGAIAELQAARVTTVVVAHSTWEGVRLWLGAPLGVLARLRGTPALPTLARADRVLIASDERLGKRLQLPSNALLVGPVLEEQPAAHVRRNRPLVLASLSTVAFPGQRAVFQHLLDAVAGLPADVAAGTGAAVDPAGLRVGANTILERRVDHAALMPQASVVVTHGGHATTVRALAHGLPMLFLPMHPMMDQPRIARAVAEQGAGIVLPKSASSEQMRAALTRLLREPRFTEAARRIGAEMVAAHGAERAAKEVEVVAGRLTTA